MNRISSAGTRARVTQGAGAAVVIAGAGIVGAATLFAGAAGAAPRVHSPHLVIAAHDHKKGDSPHPVVAGHDHKKGDGPREAGKPRALAGVVTSAPTTDTSTGVTSFTLLRDGRPDQLFTVDVSATTSYLEVGVPAPTSIDILADEHVVVSGGMSSTPGTIDTFDATRVRIIPEHSRAYPGIVTTDPTTPGVNGAASFTIEEGQRTFTVDVIGTTTYSEVGVTAPSLSNVTFGERVVVRATPTWPATTVMATSVVIVKA